MHHLQSAAVHRRVVVAVAIVFLLWLPPAGAGRPPRHTQDQDHSHDDGQDADGGPRWEHAMVFVPGAYHEAEDHSDLVAPLLYVPQAVCHGNHCNAFRLPRRIVCAERSHFAQAAGGERPASHPRAQLSRPPPTPWTADLPAAESVARFPPLPPSHPLLRMSTTDEQPPRGRRFEPWSEAVLGRYAPDEASTGMSSGPGHPMHRIRLVEHTTGGTYAGGGAALWKHWQGTAGWRGVAAGGEEGAFEVEAGRWACAAERADHIEPPFAYEHYYILCMPSADAHSAPREAGGSDPWVLGAATGPQAVRGGVSHHCTVHFHVVNYGRADAKVGIAVLVATTMVLVGGLVVWANMPSVRDDIARHRVMRTLNRLSGGPPPQSARVRDSSASTRRRQHPAARPVGLPLDVSLVGADGKPNVFVSRGADLNQRRQSLGEQSLVHRGVRSLAAPDQPQHSQQTSAQSRLFANPNALSLGEMVAMSEGAGRGGTGRQAPPPPPTAVDIPDTLVHAPETGSVVSTIDIDLIIG